MTVIQLEAKPAGQLCRLDDWVLPGRWRVEHLLVSGGQAVATGHNRQGQCYCLNLPAGTVLRTYHVRSDDERSG